MLQKCALFEEQTRLSLVVKYSAFQWSRYYFNSKFQICRRLSQGDIGFRFSLLVQNVAPSCEFNSCLSREQVDPYCHKTISFSCINNWKTAIKQASHANMAWQTEIYISGLSIFVAHEIRVEITGIVQLVNIACCDCAKTKSFSR